MHRVWMAVVGAALLWPGSAGLLAQDPVVTGSTVSLAAGAASLELSLANGETRVISLREGDLLVDGQIE
ncbi:MAG: hypothetical protein M8866_05960, partial [marine benthic group bacterium]|nr:hypothetical protein [Candidatus Benthicola marisminoris]